MRRARHKTNPSRCYSDRFTWGPGELVGGGAAYGTAPKTKLSTTTNCGTAEIRLGS
jgi:hypothetical protein